MSAVGDEMLIFKAAKHSLAAGQLLISSCMEKASPALMWNTKATMLNKRYFNSFFISEHKYTIKIPNLISRAEHILRCPEPGLHRK